MHLPGLWGSVQVVSLIMHERTRRVYGSPAELVRFLVFVACTLVYIPTFTTLLPLIVTLYLHFSSLLLILLSRPDAYWVPVDLVLILHSASIFVMQVRVLATDVDSSQLRS